ncbi:sensor histidine kinase [Cohnella sp. JJ-181]|uniref:sensor histidine kinase n=1 Tax=Cohnella rhizoplanae TaxID=2974897 RepID=UPI0022FF8804|nr:HAMP domain-containing sensor histidine kinase [Cohnella sp. JJ-181]CAI6082490.1 Adaptive-response sensory-kinase SasA [Cohnella sp. JJ-181]
MRRYSGITAKLLLAFFAVLLISFAITLLVSDRFVRSQLRDRSDRIELRQLDVTAALVRSAYREQWSRTQLTSALQMSGGPNRTVVILNAAGEVVLQTGSPNGGGTVEIDPAALRETLAARDKLWRPGDASGKGKIRIAAVPVGGDRSWSAQTVLVVSGAFQQDFNAFNGLFRNIMITMLVVSTTIVLIVSRGMTARLRRMTLAARDIAKGRFDVRLPDRHRDEIGELASSLNHMSAELGSLDRMRREFLANVSHDLRSPLTSIGGFVEAMLDGAVPPDRERHYLGLVREQTQRMNRLVNDLLDVARMEAGQLEIAPLPYNLSSWIRGLLARMSPDAGRRGIRLELIGDAEDLWVRADPDRIDQVLANLVLNAIQFSPDGRAVQVEAVREGDRARISVRDFGVGIPGEELDKIWQRFYKSDKARSARTGSGLGLAIVQFVLEKHGTAASVRSVVGEGTLFTFFLPSAEPSHTSYSVRDSL